MTYLQTPEDEGDEQVSLSRKAVQVDPEANHRKNSHGNMQMKEGFIKCMSNRRGRMKHEPDERTGSLRTVSQLAGGLSSPNSQSIQSE